MRMLSAIKDKIDDWKTKDLAKQIIQLRKSNAKLEQQLAKLQVGRITGTRETIRNDSATNTGGDNIKKHIDENTPDALYKGETSQNGTRRKETPKKMRSNSRKRSHV